MITNEKIRAILLVLYYFIALEKSERECNQTLLYNNTKHAYLAFFYTFQKTLRRSFNVYVRFALWEQEQCSC